MLNQGNKYLIIGTILFLFSCTDKQPEKKDFTPIYNSIIQSSECRKIYDQITDSVKHFVINKLPNYEAEYTYSYKIDSLICFNNDTSRLICCRHLYVNIPNAIADDLQFILGEKINHHWYFFKSASIAIPREMVEGQNINTPLSYTQLHEIALKEVYGGYLNEKGEINEKWFTSSFEGPGWGDFQNQESTLKYLNLSDKFTDKRSFFEAIHLQSVRNNWASRDTTKAIIPLTQKNNQLP